MNIRIIIREEMGNMEWIQDVEPNFDDMNLRVGDMFRVPTVNEDGSTFSIVTIIDIGLMGDKPITYKIESGMGQLQQRNVVDTKVDFIQRIIKDKWIPLYGNKGYKLNESDDFDWVREIETDLVFGEIYDIKTGNGYYWVPELYLGKEWDEEHNFEYYKFKGLGNSGGSGRKSKPYIKDLIEKGDIRPYDPSWSIKDELTFSDNIEDALKGNFVIYFKDGTYLGQTLAIQDKLFEMGFSFYTKGPNEYITNKDFSDKIQFFECFNWDNSKPRYKSMPPDQWDQKKILLNKVNKDDINWGTPNPRLGEQELFIAAKNHDATIINGDKYITNDINESNDLIRKELDNKLVGKISNNILNESDDFDWINDVKSNQDIAQEIADETEIKNGRLYPPFSSVLPFFSLLLSFSPSFPSLLLPLFTKHCKEVYGLNEDEIEYVWEEYREIIIGKNNNLNESDELGWIQDTKPTLKDAFEEGLVKGGDVLTLSGELVDNDNSRPMKVQDFKVQIVELKEVHNQDYQLQYQSYYFIPLQEKYWEFLGYDGTNDVGFLLTDGDLVVLDILKGKDVIRESDELDWIRDTIPLSYEFVNNKGLEFNPPITDEGYWNKVKSSLEAIGCVVDFDVDDWYENGVGMLGLFVEYGEVIWTTADIHQGSYQEHIDSYADKPVEVIDGRSLFPL